MISGARCRARKFKFALKIIDKTSCRDREQQIKNEVSLLRRLRHGNIVQLIDEFHTPDRLYMVMELVTVRHVTSRHRDHSVNHARP